MTIGDYPEFLAQGFLSNQGMLSKDEIVEAVDFDAELETVVVRTNTPTNYEAKLKKKNPYFWLRGGNSVWGYYGGDRGVTLARSHHPHLMAL